VAARQQVRRLIINWKRRINYMTYHKYESHSHAQTHGSGKSSEFAGQRHTSVIAADQREHMIAEAAYYLAEHRQFQGGDPLQDWFQAQQEIDSKVKTISH